MESYYRVLGVSPEASQAEIKNAFRICAKKFHPDFNPGNRSFAEARMKEINVAYEALKDPIKRRDYDRRFFQEKKSAEKSYWEQSQERYSYVRPNPSPKSAQKASNYKRGSDIYLNIKISLESAFSGVFGKVSYARQRRCPSCRGTGKLFGKRCSRCKGSGFFFERFCVRKRVLPGIRNGGKLRSAGDGNEGKSKNCFGDLYLVVNIEPHRFFNRKGNDLYCLVEVPASRIERKIRIPTLDGKVVLISIPANVCDGTVFRIRGQGMPIIYTELRGNLFVKIRTQASCP